MKLKLLFCILLSVLFNLNSNSQNTIEIDCEDVFLSGANIAWVDFASDVGRFNVYNPSVLYEPYYDSFNTYFSEIKAAGGNSVRWWLHTDASYTPQIEYSGNVTGLSAAYTNQEITDQVRKILDLAWNNGVYMTISLFSFDILSSPNDRFGTSINFVGSQNFLESPTNVQSYIDNALTPMVLALKDHPALFSWEIFNEPEGMSSEFGWTGNQGGEFTSMATIQMVVNKLAGAIHDADPEALVTNGAWSMLVNTDIELNYSYAEEYQKNYYSDSELVAAGGAANGTLDFYQVHFYDWQHENISPLHHPASYWQLDKPIMLGEFYPAQVQSIAVNNGYPVDGAYEFLYDQGYFGAWGWQWRSPWLKVDIEPQITHMQTAQPSVVDINTNGCPANTLDNDNDGVTNDIDLCPNTPNGETVNSDGCSTNDLGDSDGDGVINGTDACPNTPNGESVDENGCSTNELNDDDNDGILNGNDLCPSTPSNELVNSDGCSGSQLDNDQDGVTNDLDHCENTPFGETVNANGCTDNQIDDDQDGVINDLDLCANSPINFSVDSEGCGLINIPDSNFEQALIDLGIDSDNTINQQIKFTDAKYINLLNIPNKNISDLTGIEGFISLERLYCYSNLLTSIDISNNTALTQINVYNNQISSLDVTNNILLTNLDCAVNQLTSIDVSNNSNLTTFSVHSNPPLTSLNIKNGNNTIITTFYANVNPNLTCIQVDDPTYSTNNWTSIDAHHYYSENCGDDDVDGILNSEDNCPDTPTGEVVDATGCSEIQLNVNDWEIINELKIYPNPTESLVTLNGLTSEEVTIQVYTAIGSKLFSENYIVNNRSVVFSLEKYPFGVYIVKVIGNKNETAEFKVIKK